MSELPTPTRSDDEALVQSVNRRAGTALRMLGRSSEGTLGGALYVAWPDGRAGVITRFLGSLQDARRTASVIDEVRGFGMPVPRHEAILEVDGSVLVVQERLPGSPPTEVSTALIDAIIDLNDRFSDLLRSRPDVPTLPLCLDQSGDPYPQHEVLETHSSRSRRILDAIRAIGTNGPRTMTGTDLVHIDLTPPNILVDRAGQISGIVDWNLGAYRGDRHLALVKTRFEQEWSLQAPAPHPAEIAAAEHLDQVLRQRVQPDTLKAYWAHRMLYQLHFALQFAPTEVVKWHLDVAEARLL